MKIKYDFITNSSSAAFVVFIPKSYNLTKEMIEKTNEYADYLEMEEPDLQNIDDLVNELINHVDLLKQGQEVMVGPYGYDSLILVELLTEENLIFKHVEVDGEGSSTVTPITLDELNDFILKVKHYENEM